MRLHLLIALLLVPFPAAAQVSDDAARARAAVSRGEILRLSQVLPRIERQFGGRVLDTALLRSGRSYLYSFDLLTRDGRLIEVLVNAATGEPVSILRNNRTDRGSDGGSGRGGGRRGGDDDDDGGDDDDDRGGDDDDGGGDDDDRGGDDDDGGGGDDDD